MTARHRVLRIRRIVAALAVAAFIALFATIYVQMAAGKDPALANSSTTTTTSSQPATSEPAPLTTTQS